MVVKSTMPYHPDAPTQQSLRSVSFSLLRYLPNILNYSWDCHRLRAQIPEVWGHHRHTIQGGHAGGAASTWATYRGLFPSLIARSESELISES